ncbi:MAG: hypothetical protein PVF56_20250, partial [Desulfobacterales bacterium]
QENLKGIHVQYCPFSYWFQVSGSCVTRYAFRVARLLFDFSTFRIPHSESVYLTPQHLAYPVANGQKP